jgi:hypothetical protein
MYIKPAIARHTRMPQINVFFYAPTPSDHVLNHVVTQYHPPFSHCDVQFEDGMASSIYQYETVYWRKRGFKKPGYSKLSIQVQAADYNRAYSMCQERSAKQFEFDAIGMYTLPLMSSLQYERDGYTFCSKHCTEVLQTANVKAVAGLLAKSVTPSALQQAIQDAPLQQQQGWRVGNSGERQNTRLDLRIM